MSALGAADPPVSIVVPARDEAESLPGLLESLLAQTRPAQEIVVVEAGSSDDTVAVAQAYAGRGVRLIEAGPALPGRARNLGIGSARGEWLALVDAGCVAERRWLSSLLASLGDRRESAVVFGNYQPRIASEWDAAQALCYVAPIDERTGCRPPSTASLLIHRSAWEAAGRFPEQLRAAEDLVFFERLAAAGVPSAFCREAVVFWSLPATPGAAFRRLRSYSAQHLAAGLFRTWHRRVMLMDAAALALGLAALWWTPALLVLLVSALGRLVRTVARRRRGVPGSGFRPDRLARVAWLLVLADAATWAGAFDYALSRRGTLGS